MPIVPGAGTTKVVEAVKTRQGAEVAEVENQAMAVREVVDRVEVASVVKDSVWFSRLAAEKHDRLTIRRRETYRLKSVKRGLAVLPCLPRRL